MRIATLLVPALVAGMSLPAQAAITNTQLRARLRTAEVLPLSERSSLTVTGDGEVVLKLGSAQAEWIIIRATSSGMYVESKNPTQAASRKGKAEGVNVDAHACLTQALDPWLLTSAIKDEAREAAKGLRKLALLSYGKQKALQHWAELLDRTWHLGHLQVQRPLPTGSSAPSSTSSTTSAPAAEPKASPAPDFSFLHGHAGEAGDQHESLDPRESLAQDILRGGRTAKALQELERRLGSTADQEEEAAFQAFKEGLRHFAGLVFEHGEFRKEESREKEHKETRKP